MGPKASKPSRPPPLGTVTSQDRAVLDLKNTRDRLSKYSKSLSSAEERLLAKAKALSRQGKKDRALMLLKLRKRKAKELENVETQLLQVLQMVETLQWSTEQARVVAALKEGKDALRAMHDRVSVDDVLGLMDDVEEGRAEAMAISDALAQLGEGDMAEEEEVQEELRRMEEGMEEGPKYDVEDLPDVPVSMPVAPSGGLQKEKEKDEEKEIERVA
eukprot:CAMPEP_0182457532 /NCGR_PEP_ID=MMETSP1319-20130603/3087_1 /TAXON_ID=172717 /ORGANISM="Bolidomonas pacifica, Strain RCC208" /LENGTH=215 /DNA_ID=CAMNT_0024656025 /DNA_START=112 /DNA_END=756 /DNA_ORIENTATION=-